jgi:hypothetical protein
MRQSSTESLRDSPFAATTMYRDVDMDFCLEQEVR